MFFYSQPEIVSKKISLVAFQVEKYKIRHDGKVGWSTGSVSVQASHWPELSNAGFWLAATDTPRPRASEQEYTLDPDTDIKAGKIRIKVKNPNSKESLSFIYKTALTALSH